MTRIANTPSLFGTSVKLNKYCYSMKTKINAVSDVDALAALYVYNDATPPVRPLGEFPDVPSS